jgi:hypothetical protein
MHDICIYVPRTPILVMSANFFQPFIVGHCKTINMGKKIRRHSMRRNEQICARVTANEMAAVRSMAESQSMLLSQFIRQALAEKLASLTMSPGRAERPVSHRRDETIGVL